jgi:beta-N-acetylhexosaminidase
VSDLEALAGRVLMVGFEGPRLTRGTEERLRRLGPGGAILFRRNLEEPSWLVDLVERLREALPPPALLAIDQEGGRVSRLETWVGPTPSAVQLAAAGGPAAFRFGRATGEALKALGFNLDFAPVVDLNPPDQHNGIGDRSFGNDPALATLLAGSFLDGLQGAGVAGCLKHFPGLGGTDVDSHESLPTCDRDRARLEECDLAPYRELGERAAAVMVAHALYPSLDPEGEAPATLNAMIVERRLRLELGYRGLIVSDDLEMGAVAAFDRDGAAAVAAIAAGCDLLPYCSDLERAEAAKAALVQAARGDAAFRKRLEQAARTVTQTAARWPAPRPDLAAWEPALRELREAAAVD